MNVKVFHDIITPSYYEASLTFLIAYHEKDLRIWCLEGPLTNIFFFF